MTPKPRDHFDQQERYVAQVYPELPTDPSVLFLLAHDVFLREFKDLTPEAVSSDEGQYFLCFVRRALVLAPDGHPCDASGQVLGYEVAVYPTDDCGQVSNAWAWRYEASAVDVESALRRLRHSLANGLVDKTICLEPVTEPQPEPLSLDDTARFVRLLESSL